MFFHIADKSLWPPQLSPMLPHHPFESWSHSKLQPVQWMRQAHQNLYCPLHKNLPSINWVNLWPNWMTLWKQLSRDVCQETVEFTNNGSPSLVCPLNKEFFQSEFHPHVFRATISIPLHPTAQSFWSLVAILLHNLSDWCQWLTSPINNPNMVSDDVDNWLNISPSKPWAQGGDLYTLVLWVLVNPFWSSWKHNSRKKYRIWQSTIQSKNWCPWAGFSFPPQWWRLICLKKQYWKKWKESQLGCAGYARHFAQRSTD